MVYSSHTHIAKDRTTVLLIRNMQYIHVHSLQQSCPKEAIQYGRCEKCTLSLAVWKDGRELNLCRWINLKLCSHTHSSLLIKTTGRVDQDTAASVLADSPLVGSSVICVTVAGEGGEAILIEKDHKQATCLLFLFCTVREQRTRMVLQSSNHLLCPSRESSCSAVSVRVTRLLLSSHFVRSLG